MKENKKKNKEELLKQLNLKIRRIEKLRYDINNELVGAKRILIMIMRYLE